MKQKFKLGLLLVLLIPCWVVGWKFGQDLPVYHTVAKWLVSGEIDKIFAPDRAFHWWYCPAALIFFKPLGFLSFTAVKILWLGLHTVSYVFFWLAMTRLYPWLRRREVFFGWLVVFIMAINPIHTNFQAQNISLWLAAGLLWTEVLSRSQSAKTQFLAGFLGALVASIKLFPFFVVFFYLLVKPNSVKKGLIAGIFFVAVIPFLYFGVDSATALYFDWIGYLTQYKDVVSMKISPEQLSLPRYSAGGSLYSCLRLNPSYSDESC